MSLHGVGCLCSECCGHGCPGRDEVARLEADLAAARAEVERLAEALRRIVNYRGGLGKPPPDRAMRYIARETLGLDARSDGETKARAALAAHDNAEGAK